MSDDTAMRDLFDRWERVWHEGQFDLVPSCVGENYIRHVEAGDRTITREAYAAEIAKIQQERPGIRVVVYDHSFQGSRAWFRFAFRWRDPAQSSGHAVLPHRGWQARSSPELSHDGDVSLTARNDRASWQGRSPACACN